MPATLPPTDFEKCLAMIYQEGFVAAWSNPLGAAEKLPRIVEVLTQQLPADQGRDLRALTLYALSALRLRKGRREDSQQLREQAQACIQEGGASAKARQNALFQHLMAHVLMKLEDFSGAIPFWERAINLEGGRNAVESAEMLCRVGQCYRQTGLLDHSEISLRAALKIFRNYPEDPRYTAVLIGLGNALRKSSPGEAERCYVEAAGFHESRGELESATAPWVNLGVLCSEQGRHEESLAYYQKALRVREQSARTSAERMGSLDNNIANCYRRMGRFAEAHEAVGRAIAILEPEGGDRLAAAYGTRGEILQDEQRYEEAVEWFRKSYELRSQVPSPNLEIMVENLEHEIAALKRLGWSQKAADAERQLDAVRAKMAAVPKMERDVGGRLPEGAVLIELTLGMGTAGEEWKRDCEKLAQRLAEAVEERQAGSYSGLFARPEKTILVFYGNDGEELYRAMMRVLFSHAVCEGARVTIRHGCERREVMLQGRVM